MTQPPEPTAQQVLHIIQQRFPLEFEVAVLTAHNQILIAALEDQAEDRETS